MASARITVREATAADADSIADVHVASIRELGREAYDDEQIRAWFSNVHPERYPLEEAGFRVVVAEREGGDSNGDGRSDVGDRDGTEDAETELVGFGLLDCEPSGCDDDSTGEIGAVYVHPDHVRNGVGRAILETLESAARHAGLETLVLTASKNALEFYRRAGYEGVETVSLEMEEGVSLECLRMRRKLDRE